MVIPLTEIRKPERGSLCEFSPLPTGHLSDYIKGKLCTVLIIFIRTISSQTIEGSIYKAGDRDSSSHVYSQWTETLPSMHAAPLWLGWI